MSRILAFSFLALLCAHLRWANMNIARLRQMPITIIPTVTLIIRQFISGSVSSVAEVFSVMVKMTRPNREQSIPRARPARFRDAVYAIRVLCSALRLVEEILERRGDIYRVGLAVRSDWAGSRRSGSGSKDVWRTPRGRDWVRVLRLLCSRTLEEIL